MTSRSGLRIGEAVSSMARSPPLAEGSKSARRLRFTAAPLVSAWCTGSASRRRSASSTSVTTSSIGLPKELAAWFPVSCSAAGFMKVTRPSLSVAMMASARDCSASSCGSAAAPSAGEAQRLHGLGRNDLDAGDQQRVALVVLDQGRGDLEAAHLSLQAHHVDLVALGGGLPGQAPGDVLAHQLRVLRRHQIGQAPSDELDPVDADEAGELAVGVEDYLAVHQHGFVDAVAEVGEEFGRLGGLAVGARSGAGQEVVNCGDQDGDLRLVARHLHAPGEPPANGNALQLLGEFLDASHVAALQRIKHEDQSGDEGEQEA